MAESLEIDGAMVLPLVEDVAGRLERSGLDTKDVRHVVDVGCGPGIVTCALAERFPAARLTGLDSAPELLDGLRARARDAGLAPRIEVVEGDIEHELPALPPADIVWASMVVHHVADPVATLRRLGGLLRPDGTLVLVEFGDIPSVLPDDDPLVAGGTWQRLENAARASLAERLGPGVIDRDWPRDLALLELRDVTDEVLTFSHDAPLDEIRRCWLTRHVRRGTQMAGDTLGRADVEALEGFADAVEAGERPDAFVNGSRRVLTARRPPAD